MTYNGKRPYDIAVVGLGIAGIHQMTREAEETIRRANKTFVTDMAVGVEEHLRSLAPEVVDLASRYKPGEHRIKIYRDMASEVVAAALEEPPVCFATYGHPKIYCYPTMLIERAARVLDLRVEVLPGVSFLDTLLVDVGVDPGADGLQLYEATDLVIRRRPLQPDVGCVISQGPITLEAYNRPGLPNPDNLQLLQDHLLEFYPGEHEVVLGVSKTHPLLPPLAHSVPISRLADALARSSNVVTLYIPPVSHREADPELVDRMKLPDEHERAPESRAGRPTIGPQPGQ